MLADLLLIVADDLSPELLAKANTPNLDALAAVSTTYTAHHGEAACSLSRATLLTGKYAFQHKVGSIFNQNKDTGWSLEITNPQTLLPNLVPGSSALVGKHHLNSAAYPAHPVEVCGYDYFVGTPANLGKPNGYYSYKFYDSFTSSFYDSTTYATGFFCAEAEIALDGYSFVQLNLHAAHDPLHWPPQGTYSSTDQRVAIVEAMDYYLGPVLDAAKLQDKRIVFTADNGGDKDVGGKGNFMTSALRVPLIVHNTGQIVPSVVSDLTDWHSLRYWVQAGTMAFPSVTNHDKFKGVEHVDWSTYEEAIITENWKLILKSDGTQELYAMPEETLTDNDAVVSRLWRYRLNK